MKLLLTTALALTSLSVWAGPGNIAPLAKATATSATEAAPATGAIDGIIRQEGRGEWASADQQTFWGEINMPTLTLEWPDSVTINAVTLYDRVGESSHTAGVCLRFGDGTRLDVGQIPDDGAPRKVTFPPRRIKRLDIEVIDCDGSYPGLSEVEVFPAPESYTSLTDYVVPETETIRGRYFFHTTGSLPQGMLAASPMTRNKNQGGGGYNYNDRHILGFPQVHGWMLSGLDFMPARTGVNPCGGEKSWKSAFSHDSEIAQPGYHRLYLDDYDLWVEQTCTDRASIYRMVYTREGEACLLFNLGGYVGTSTMVNADVKAVGGRRLEGSFDTVGRLWGGPDKVTVYFVAEVDRDMASVDSWDEKGVTEGVISLRTSAQSTPRNEWMSYHDAPTAGLALRSPVALGDTVQVKMAISYVSLDNARENLALELPGWDFDEVRKAAQDEWNRQMGRILVEGGTDRQRQKFYTDLWHTLLGRHKIDDANGEYPDRTTGGRIDWKWVRDIPVKTRTLAKDADGKAIHHMYNSDAVWLTQWNQNALWGMAWPSLLDGFSASMVQYGINGGLIPRGPCGGGYSFIMSGCPATSMITSAYQRGLDHKFDARKAYALLRRNHERGGMLGYNSEKEFEVYMREGYAPEKVGLTVQWAFEDWALAQMAQRLGKKKDAATLLRRSRGWRKLMHPELHLLLPRREDGSWAHTDPLNGWGYEEANAWQTTFGLSHDLDGLAEAMGGRERLCAMLDSAMRMSVSQDFVGGYGNGYVSYANQPGLSTAHVFAHAGRPDLTQYWVRQVKEQAYGDITPERGYGGHDEDQGQMSAVSALMAIGLFSINGGSAIDPAYDITTPVFDKVTIALDPEYYPGGTFTIVTHGNSPTSHYIRRATLNGRDLCEAVAEAKGSTGAKVKGSANAKAEGSASAQAEAGAPLQLPHKLFARGGTLDLYLTDTPRQR